MTDNSKKEFVQSLKQLNYFFNNLKEVHGQFDTTLQTLYDE
jgi:hypothetical protein